MAKVILIMLWQAVPIHFDETERGKTVYVALTWQNERGIRGQWSDIKSAIVP